MTTPAVLAIDPGSAQSAWLLFADGRPQWFGISPNEELLTSLRDGRPTGLRGICHTLVIEQIESYGMAVGREVFETVHWSGRFAEAAYPQRVAQLPRRAVKLAICGDSRAKDANIRTALIDRFGGEKARGTKAAPGPLYGISKDVWSALAIAVTYTAGDHRPMKEEVT